MKKSTQFLFNNKFTSSTLSVNAPTLFSNSAKTHIFFATHQLLKNSTYCVQPCFDTHGQMDLVGHNN